jgi:hypothetical protein
MKHAFIRGLWGVYDDSHETMRMRYRMDAEIQAAVQNQFTEKFVTYVLGEDNYNGIKKIIPDAIMLSKEPFIFDIVKFQHRHKLELIKHAMENDGYDEVVWLDWDCIPTKKLPFDFWDYLGKKEVFQSNLQRYKHIKSPWRNKDQGCVPNGGYLYLRDKNLVSSAIKIWETMKQNNDEPAWAKLTDEMMGGWEGIDKYWKFFESECSNIRRMSPFPAEMVAQKKHVCFLHRL